MAPPHRSLLAGRSSRANAELSLGVGDLRQQISDLIPKSVVDISQSGVWSEKFRTSKKSNRQEWLMEHCGVNESGAEQTIDYVIAGRVVLGPVPTQKTVIAERFFDEGGGMQLIIHAPFGGRINKAWGLALRKRFCRSFNFELQAAATDNGINIALAEQHSFPLADVFQFLHPNTLQDTLEQAALRLAHLRHALALGCEPRPRPAALPRWQESPTADPAHAR